MSEFDITEEGEEPDPLDRRAGATARFCPTCGARAGFQHRFCAACGKPLAA